MGIATRFYLFLDDGSIRRVPQRIAYEMPFGRDGIPEFAGTRQRVASVLVESEGGRPARILDARGSYWDFDAEGRINESIMDLVGERMKAHDAAERARRTKVTDLRPEIKMRELRAKHKWVITADDLDRLTADIWPGCTGWRRKSRASKEPSRRSHRSLMRDAGRSTALRITVKGASRKEAIEACRRPMARRYSSARAYRAQGRGGERG